MQRATIKSQVHQISSDAFSKVCAKMRTIVYNQSISNASNDSAIVSLNYGAPYQNAHFGITDPTQQGMIYNSGNFEILFNNSPNGVVWSLASLSSASASPSQSPTPTPSPQSSLSTGAKAGIAVGVIVGALVLLAAGTLILLMRKKRKAASENSYHRTRELDDGKAGKADIARTPVVEIDANTEMRTELPTGEDKMHELETDGGQAHELSGGWDSIRGLKTPTSVRGPMTPTSVHKFNTPTSIHEPTTPDSSRGSKTSISASRLKLPKSLGR
ncbi:hypothetical protein MMC06_001813 [Schaereria dolodes]|nr:hypothetical protein [Schaereria dolodes]